MRTTTRTTMTALVTTAVTAGLLLAAPYASADDDDREGADRPIEIEAIHYNPPGGDGRAILNQEFVTIENDTPRARSLSGWTLRDAAGNTYRFGAITVPADSEVRIHTGSGTDTARDRYWGRTRHVWNNGGDAATLRSATSTRIDTCSYTGGRHVADC
jgi:hypothetical protein